MTRSRRILRRVPAIVVLAVLACPLHAAAQTKPAGSPAAGSPATLPQDSAPSNEPKTREQLEAQQHFQRAKDLYQTGSYREAIAELEAARLLDPKAKDLVFNLGIVHEKLGKYDEAIAFFRQYMQLESVTASERGKAENIIKRIEGAKREVPIAPSPNGAAAGSAAVSATDPAPSPPAEEKHRGRIDAATITAGSIAVVGLGVGTVFGILALSSKPNDFVTGRDGTYETLKQKNDDASTQAVVADVGFGVGIAGAVAAALLYFGRNKDSKPASAPAPAATRLLPSVAVLSGGGAVLLGGTFP